MVDFDTIVIKQMLAQAPMNIEVARRKEFIDAKEGKPRGKSVPAAPAVTTVPVNEFELDTAPVQTGRVEAPVPDLPKRK
jgi:hypothetical protein